MGKKRGKSKQAKAAQKGQIQQQGIEDEYKKAPHSFIFNRGQVGKNVAELIMDMRRVMEPYTAEQLQTRKKNVLKDFVSVAGLLNVSHFIIFTKTEQGVYMKMCRLPRGPTLTFQVQEYSLARDVISSLKKHHMEAKQFQHHPLLVMNAFSGEGMHMKLMTTMFQNMFPSINVNKVKLNDIRRTALFSYDAESDTVEFRHYNVRTVPVGASRGVKKILKSKVPNLGQLEEFSEYLAKGCDFSESEAEMDGDHNTVTLPQQMSARGCQENGQSAIRLCEIGPRLRLKLIKIEEGLCEGDILYHGLVQKTPEEMAAIKAERQRKKQEKAERKRLQEKNVQKKENVKAAHKEKSLAGMKRKSGEDGNDDDEVEAPELDNKVDSDSDAEYYRQEVGENPDKDLFPKKRKRSENKSEVPHKKQKLDAKKSKDKDSKGDKHQKEKKPLTELDKIKRRKDRLAGKTKRPKRGPKKGGKKEAKEDNDGEKGEMDVGKGGGFKKKFDGKKSGFGAKGGKDFGKGGKGGKSFGKGGKGGKDFSKGGKGGMKGKKAGAGGKGFKGKKGGRRH